MQKRHELADPNSCLNRAKDDEVVFVLLERDPCTPKTIRSWAANRVLIGKNRADDDQITNALATATAIDRGENYELGQSMLEQHEDDLFYAMVAKLGQLIEAIPASTEQTAASAYCSDLRQAVGNRFNPSDAYAMLRVITPIVTGK